MTQQPTTWRGILQALDVHLENFKQARGEASARNDDNGFKDDGPTSPSRLIRIMVAACELIRQAEARDDHDLPEIVEKVGNFVDSVISFAYSDKAFIRCIPSFAHGKDTLVKDPMKGPIGGQGFDFAAHFESQIFGRPAPRQDPNRGVGLAGLFPWTKELDQSHPRTTPLSRFRKDAYPPASALYPTANIVYQARCEITDDCCYTPISLELSSDSSCLALSAAGGYKETDPVIHAWLQGEGKEMKQFQVKASLADPALYLTLDSDRKLMFVADKDRVKSYSWENGSGKAVHTMNSDEYTGPLSLLPGGRIIRGGVGSILSWTIDDLETHSTTSGLIGRGKYSGYHKIHKRFDEKEKEYSTGSLPTTVIPLADSGLFTLNFRWHQPTQRLLCSENWPERKSYAVVALDLEHGGKTATRYVGHGGGVGHLSLSEDDHNTFLTTCSDGFTRLYDIRNPLPVLTLDVERQDSPCLTAVYTHIDGIPTIFTGGHKSECVKLWDVRAKKTVVEMSTGNNSVTSMVWNRKNTTLYAATECPWIDRFGNHYDYRASRPHDLWKVPEALVKSAKTRAPESGSDIPREESNVDKNRMRTTYWPERAYHDENYFGAMFDSGSHSLFTYKFKEDADPSAIPRSGTIESSAESSTPGCPTQ